MCAHTYLDIHQVKAYFLKFWHQKLVLQHKKVVPLHRNQKRRLVEALRYQKDIVNNHIGISVKVRLKSSVRLIWLW